MAIHWQVKFRSLRSNILFTANVYDESYTEATPVQLTGAAVPFETQEDDSDDPFEPVRLQSGYLRIVDTDEDNDGNPFDWRTFIPTTDTDRPVMLTNEDGTVLWMGFMQAQNFGARLFETPQEREFPLQCPLTVTSRADINHAQTQIQNFAYMLLQVVDGIPSPCRPTSFVIHGGTKAREWLTKRIDWQNFVTTDDDGNLAPKYDLLQCLTEMCRFWGWTARMNRQVLYLVSADDNSLSDFLTLSYNELASMSSGTSDVGSISTGFTPAGFGDDIFASVNNDDFQMRGPNKAVVSVSLPSDYEEPVQPFSDKMENTMVENIYVNSRSYLDWDSKVVYSEDVLSLTDNPLIRGYAAHSYASFNFALKLNLNTGAGGDRIGNVIRIKKTYDGTIAARISTKYAHNFSNGFFRFYGTIYREGKVYENRDGDTFMGNCDMWMRLGIGTSVANAKWWDGTKWVNSDVVFRMSIGNRDDLMYTRYWPNYPTPPLSDRGSIIPTPDILAGRMFIQFLGSDYPALTDYDGEKKFDIEGFHVVFTKNDNVAKQKMPNSGWYYIFDKKDIQQNFQYKASTTNVVKDETDIDCIFASSRVAKPSLPIITNSDDTQFTGTDYDGSGTLVHPEQHLADRIIAYWQTSRRKLDCELRDDKVTELTPKVVGTIDGTRIYPVSVSHNWRDEVLRVIFIELPEQNI